MELQTIYRTLVETKDVSDFDYVDQWFPFKTVFFKSACSYCCCPCGFEHEYLDFISNTGEINVEMYEKITKCILNGQCPHVDDAPKDYVKPTKINGLHIAAAVGTKGSWLERRCQRVETELYQLNPVHIAALKDQHTILPLLWKIYPLWPISQFFYYGYRINGPLSSIAFQHITLLELCVRTDRLLVLKSILDIETAPLGLDRALVYTFENHTQNVQDILSCIERFVEQGLNYRSIVWSCIKKTIICNKPVVLDQIMQCTFSHFILETDLKPLYMTCRLLKRFDCIDILLKYGICHQDIVPDDELEGLVNLLASNYEQLQEEIMPLLKSNQNTAYLLNRLKSNKASYLHSYLNYASPQPDCRIVNALLDLGADVNSLYSERYTPVRYLMALQKQEPRLFYSNVRGTLEVLLYHNPDLTLHARLAAFSDSTIGLAINIDRLSNFMPCKVVDEPGCYILDSRLHSYSGHDGDDENYALNFFAPLLIECGMPYSRDDLLEILRRFLHPAEHVYIQKCLDNPRSLKLRCRDVLRQWYRGRYIHTYVESTNMPNSIKDFILLKSTLLMYSEPSLQRQHLFPAKTLPLK